VDSWYRGGLVRGQWRVCVAAVSLPTINKGFV
jgi:hypothetical protein